MKSQMIFGLGGFALTAAAGIPNLAYSMDLPMQEAYQAIQAEPQVRNLLQDKVSNTLVFKKALGSNSELETIQFQHYYKGVRVLGSMAFHMKGKQGTSVRSQIFNFDLDATPKLTKEEATAIARSLSGDQELKKAPELQILPAERGNSAQLIYSVETRGNLKRPGRTVFVDAHSGKIVANLSDELNIENSLYRKRPTRPAPAPAPAPASDNSASAGATASVAIYSAKSQGIAIVPHFDDTTKSLKDCVVVDLGTMKGTQDLDPTSCQNLFKTGDSPLFNGQCQVVEGQGGSPMTISLENCPKVLENGQSNGADDAAQRAANNTKAVLAYYQSHFNRNSYDNQGSEVRSIVHAGYEYSNAAWLKDQDFMMYGDGDGQNFGDFTQALDVAGHEMTHGVTAHTANLLSMGEAGALNEAYSDFFGKMIENKDDWVIGRGILLGSSAPEGIRDLANPGNLTDSWPDASGTMQAVPYPANVKDEKFPTQGETCDMSNDRCFIHFNATIPGHASYLIAQAIGKEKTEKLYYVTLTQNLGERETFASAAKATEDTCAQLFDDSTCSSVKDAFAQVGL